MTTLRQLIVEAKAERYAPPDELHYMLEKNAELFIELWESAKDHSDYDGVCIDCGEDPFFGHNHACVLEALRPIMERRDG